MMPRKIVELKFKGKKEMYGTTQSEMVQQALGEIKKRGKSRCQIQKERRETLRLSTYVKWKQCLKKKRRRRRGRGN
jgi:hypothetical protein